MVISTEVASVSISDTAQSKGFSSLFVKAIKC
jgi:hypothetical protein